MQNRFAVRPVASVASSTLATTLATTLAAALLSACPLNWDQLNRPEPPADDAGVIPNRDGGLPDSGSPLDAGDAGGFLDGGDSGVVDDAGGGDGGGDAGGDGGLDGGPDGGLDAGPDCVMPPVTGTGWACLTSSSGTFTDCPPSTHGPVVRLLVQCPETFVLHETGVIESVNGSGVLQIRNSRCAQIGSAPLNGFTDFDVRGTRAVLWNENGPQMCYADLNSESSCVCLSTGTVIRDAILATDNRIIAAFADGFIREAGFAPPLSDPQTLFDAGGEFSTLVTVTRDDDTYVVGGYQDGRAPICHSRTPDTFDVSSSCAGSNTGDGVWPTFTDAEEQQGERRRVHGFDAVTGTAVEQVTDLNTTPAPLLRRRTLTAQAFIEPISFSGQGQLNTASSRLAIGHRGGGLQLATGTNGNFAPAPLLPTNAAELGDIRDMTFGRAPTTNVPNTILWAVSDTGIWLTDFAGQTVSPPIFALAFAFTSEPATAEVAILAGSEVLVVGEVNGTIHLFDVMPGGTLPTLVYRTTYAQLTTSNALSNIPEAIVGVSANGWSHLVIMTTGDEVWSLSIQDNAEPSTGLVLWNNSLFATSLAVPNDGRFLISQRVPLLPSLTTEQFFITGKSGNAEFSALRYAVTASDEGGAGAFAVDPVTSPAVIPAPDGTAAAFRFAFDSTNGGNTAFWTTDDGTVIAVPVIDGNLDTLGASTTSLQTPLTGGSFAIRQSVACGLAFAANSPVFYAFPMSLGDYVPVDQPVPNRTQVNAVIALNSTRAVAAGNGGHLFEITISNGVDCSVNVTDVNSLHARVQNDMTQLKWRRDNELLVADAAGRVWIVHVP